MTTLELDDETAEALKKCAESRGVSVETYLRILAEFVEPKVPPTTSTSAVKEFDLALDELFASDTRVLPASPLTYSREDIYIDHD